MTLGPAEAAGHICQRISSGFSTEPALRSALATSTSTVSNRATGSERGGLVSGSAGKQSGKTAGRDCNPEHHQTRGFHTLHFPQMTQPAGTWP